MTITLSYKSSLVPIYMGLFDCVKIPKDTNILIFMGNENSVAGEVCRYIVSTIFKHYCDKVE